MSELKWDLSKNINRSVAAPIVPLIGLSFRSNI